MNQWTIQWKCRSPVGFLRDLRGPSEREGESFIRMLRGPPRASEALWGSGGLTPTGASGGRKGGRPRGGGRAGLIKDHLEAHGPGIIQVRAPISPPGSMEPVVPLKPLNALMTLVA